MPANKKPGANGPRGAPGHVDPRETTTANKEHTAPKPKEKKKSTGKPAAPQAKHAAKTTSKKASKATPNETRPTAPPDIRAAEVAIPVVGIGASAGGLEAFESFFKAMPPDSGLAFVLVAHLDPTHVSLLPDLLQNSTKMKVQQIRDSMNIEANTVYVIPPNYDLSILNGALHLMELSQPRGAKLPIDNFFRSLAQDQGAKATCIILSGTGTDGTLGLKAIKGEVGMVMVQEPSSAKYDGMPRSAIATGLADYILPPEKMPGELIQYTHLAHGKARPHAAPGENVSPDALQKIFIILRSRTGHDFSLYKNTTILRRVQRRMSVHQIGKIADYVRYLRESEREVDVLFKELLIGVTNFFRDPEAFQTLADTVLPSLLAEKNHDQTIRVWVPGCSTGEEAYSIAIILHECMDPEQHCNVQVFGTDIDESAIAAARAGLYPPSILPDVGPERLRRYFSKVDDGQYRVKQIIREMLVFAPQNIIKDPPFINLDLLCCRNLLIYLGPELQKKLLPMFHYALKPNGVLFLGSSETIGQANDLFATLSRKWKIFQRKPTSSAARATLALPAGSGLPEEPTIPNLIRKSEELNVLRLVEIILAQTDAPPCIVIDDACNLVYVHGHTGAFLEPAQGKASMNALQMARPGLKAELAAAVRKAIMHKQEVVLSGLQVTQNGEHIAFDLIARPILQEGPEQGLIMVLFQELSKSVKRVKAAPDRGTAKGQLKSVEELELELQHTKENLQTTIEELETSNEELKSTNEELQSTNEELQSTNEEMETSKEELQSLNEESATVNAELQGRIDELSEVNDDMKNLLDSTDIATLFLDIDLNVRRFTPAATKLIPLTNTDCGRPIQHFSSSLVGVDIVSHAKDVLSDLAIREFEVTDTDGNFYVMRNRPYRSTNNVIEGVVVTFQNITELKHATASARAAQVYAENIVQTMPTPLLVLNEDLRVVSVNNAFLKHFGMNAQAAAGSLLFELGRGQWDTPELRRLLTEMLPSQLTVEDYEVEIDIPGIGKRGMLINVRQLQSADGAGAQILLGMRDISVLD